MTENTALYVYALLPDRPDAAEGVTGLDGRPLSVVAVPGTGVAALVHEATPTPFQGDDDRVRRWVAEQSEAVTTVWERVGSVLPMTFNVLVAADTASGRTAEQRLGDWVREQEAEVTGQLEALSGRCELRVEVTLDREAAAAAGGTAADPAETGTAARSPGMRRLLAKQREQREKNAAGQVADTLHAGLRRRLLSVVEDLRDRGASHRDPAQTDVLSAALLVRHEDIDSVGAVLSDAQAGQPALRIRFLGPWPPYSFAETRPQAAVEHAAG
ncbi:GvpL/GvpF family gas vesicle protein [Streptomyces sp. NPDC006284]|uniref:GvpL/GvpF family gas vesicle protein n=1 Tax=unclassified Streptomyces TaxID=2593676 RepID=UPI0033A80FC8